MNVRVNVEGGLLVATDHLVSSYTQDVYVTSVSPHKRAAATVICRSSGGNELFIHSEQETRNKKLKKKKKNKSTDILGVWGGGRI